MPPDTLGYPSYAYDTSQVGTPWQEFVKAVPVLATGFEQVYGAITGRGALDQVVATPQPAPQPAPEPAPVVDGSVLVYGALGLGGLLAVVLVVKALD